MILTIAVTMLVLGVLIFVHELGHFMAAKSVDIEVSRFSIGLGPKMFGVQRGETEYVFSWMPLGGYVKMAGMADEEVTAKLEGGVEPLPSSNSDRDFDAKPIWARVWVLSAGVMMNWLFAAIAFIAIAIGQGVNEPRITSVAEGSPAERAGLRADDLIRRVHSLVTIEVNRVVDQSGIEESMCVIPCYDLIRSVHTSIGWVITRFPDSGTPVVNIVCGQSCVWRSLHGNLQPLTADGPIREDNGGAVRTADTVAKSHVNGECGQQRTPAAGIIVITGSEVEIHTCSIRQ